jgi:RNA polymerase sigma-70 factor (ECF subfamily)
MDQETPDDELVRLARGGDDAAFSALVRRHAGVAFRVSLRLTGSVADAEEAMQEAFLQLHKKLAEFRGEARFSTWFYRIVTNAALMNRRSARRRRTEPIDVLMPAFDEQGTHARLDVDCLLPELPDALAERGELRTKLVDALESLPDGYREAFVLRDLEELSSEEVGAVLGLDAAAVRQRVHRARLTLRGLLRKTLRGEP